MKAIDLEQYCAEILSFCADNNEKLGLEILLFSKEDKFAKSIELCFYHLKSTQISALGSPWLKKIVAFEIDGSRIGLPIDSSIFSEESPRKFRVLLENNNSFEVEAYGFCSLLKKEISRR